MENIQHNLEQETTFSSKTQAHSTSATRFTNYLSSASLIWLAVGIYRLCPYYKEFLRIETQQSLALLAIAYTILGGIWYLLPFNGNKGESRGYVIYRALWRLVCSWSQYIRTLPYKPNAAKPMLEEQDRVAILFAIVKLFYLPLMLNFLFDNYGSVNKAINSMSGVSMLITAKSFNSVVYPFLFSLLLLIDTTCFTFGYAFEATFLKNKVRSVEPTALGWAVALACYPPFNGLMSKYIPWHANDYVYFYNEETTCVMRILLIVLMSIYAIASVMLGTKASNLTNRGIVAKWPYSMVRHPAYVSKNLVWWISIIPTFSFEAFCSASIWSIIYFMRAITEERHLIADPDYQKYCKKVRFRFFPGLF